MDAGIIEKHHNEMSKLRRLHSREWVNFLWDQQRRLVQEKNIERFAELFDQEREEHKKKAFEAKKDLFRKQQKELEEWKKIQALISASEEL